MLRIITTNVNGIRSAAKKGFFEWINEQKVDCLCLQEIKVSADNLAFEFVKKHGLQSFFHHSKKKGYSGVAIYGRYKPDNVISGFGSHKFDHEGRYIEVRYGSLSIASVYMPSGSSGHERQNVKYQFMDELMSYLSILKRTREVILCGDMNIVHKDIDIKNWKGNQKNSGCLLRERLWLTKLFDDIGYVDVFRLLDPRPEQYTWWSNRGQAYLKNVGWRIDYQIATPIIADTAKYVSIFRNIKFSDHSPLTVDYDHNLRITHK
ncbi:MAG: exodeoxyribonuclease III [Burkholderia sp.]|nr:exodeoxyribonuclease III [Burkholderia sp.]